MANSAKTSRPIRPGKELAFTIKDIARLIQTVADQEVRRFGMTQAQWSVLTRLEMHQGLKQSEIAEMLDLQPITLTRLLDKLAESGLIERRPDPQDRRAWRLYLTSAARPLMNKLDDLGRELGIKILNGISPAQVETMLTDLGAIHENLRRALNDKSANSEVKRYG